MSKWIDRQFTLGVKCPFFSALYLKHFNNGFKTLSLIFKNLILTKIKHTI